MDIASQVTDPWAWTLSSTLVVIGWVVTLAIAIIGWVITFKKDKAAKKTVDDNLAAALGRNETLDKQLAAQREANELYRKVHARPANPWSDAINTTRSAFVVKNDSNDEIVVESVQPSDPALAGFFDFGKKLPMTVGSGESFEYIASGSFQTGQVNTLVKWRWSDEETIHERKFMNVKS